MLGFWGFRRDPRPLGEAVEELPDPPARGYAAFLLAVESEAVWPRVRSWADQMRAARPGIPLGLVVGPDPHLRAMALRSPERWTLTLRREDYVGEIPPRALLEPLLRSTVARGIVAAWEALHGAPADDRALLEVLARLAAEGRGVDAVARELGTSRATLERELRGMGLPTPGFLLRQGRVAAYDIRRSRGMSAGVARALCGWETEKACWKAIRRLGESRLRIDGEGFPSVEHPENP